MNKGNKSELDKLVAAGIISQDKADAIKATMPAPKAHDAVQSTTTTNQ